MGQTKRIGKHKTKVWEYSDGSKSVVYHDTEIVTVYNDGRIRLNTGGYFTVTTKRRMNQAASQFGLDYRVYQKNFQWYVWCPTTNKVAPFESNSIEINDNFFKPLLRVV